MAFSDKAVGSPGAEYAKNQELMTGLGYAYQINNGFTPTEHQVRVSVNGVVGVDGTVTTGVSGGVQAGGKVGSSTSDGTASGELSASGSLGLTFMETTSRSYTVLQDTVEYVLRLKVVEKD